MATNCGQKRVEGSRVDRETRTGGVGEEWEGLPLFHSERLRLLAAVANDSTHLDVVFRFHDGQLARHIHFAGLTLWVDPKCKEEKERIRLSGRLGRGPLGKMSERQPRRDVSREGGATAQRNAPREVPALGVWLIPGYQAERGEEQPLHGPARWGADSRADPSGGRLWHLTVEGDLFGKPLSELTE